MSGADSLERFIRARVGADAIAEQARREREQAERAKGETAQPPTPRPDAAKQPLNDEKPEITA